MNFILVSPGINVAKDKIVSIEDIDGMSCTIITASSAYKSIYPSWYILMKLEEQDVVEPLAPPQTPNRVNLWGNQYWAG